MVRLTEDNSILPNERGMTDIYERKHAAKRKIPCEGAVSLSVLLLCIIIKTSNENIQYIYCYSHAFRLHGKKKKSVLLRLAGVLLLFNYVLTVSESHE